MPYLDNGYQFSTSFLAPLAMSAEVPPGEGPSPGYLFGRAKAAADLPLNLAAAKARTLLDPFDALEDYDDIFVTLPTPAVAQTWRTDRMFAEQRVAGVNPIGIRRVVAVPDGLDRDAVDRSLKRLLAHAAANARLYAVDHREVLDGIPDGTWDRGPKYFSGAVALFTWRETLSGDRGELVPVAVGVEGRTFTPFDAGWSVAKLAFQVADGQVHEMWTHLYGAHFAMEPVAVAVGRYLPETHAVRVLLAPHLRFLLYNNELGKNLLVNPGGYVDTLLAAPLSGSLEIVKRAAAAFDLGATAFDADLAARGLADKADLPHYPFRDDGQLHWTAIGTLCAGWANRAYADDAAVAADVSLGRFVAALSSPNEARLKGVPEVRTRGQVAWLLQRLIFNAGPYHAAVNFSQWEYYAYTPNMPLSMYAPLPAAPTGSEAELLALLPPYKQTVKQLQIMDLLASYRYDRLGVYPDGTFRTAWQAKLAADFRKELDAAEGEIDRRNGKRATPYPYLKPSLVPNSTSV